MGIFSGLTEAGASALSAGVGFLGNLGGSVAGGLFSANQAKKNRAFQERMYNRQYEDTIKFWNMQNEYNLPSAVYQREMEGLQKNGLNPLLMYGSGSPQGVSTGAPQLPSAPHGAQASVGSFNTRLDLANLALVEAQADALRAGAEKDRQDVAESQETTQGIVFDNMMKRFTAKLDIALKWSNYDMMNSTIRNINSEYWSRENMTTQNVLSMMQDRNLQLQRFHWQKEYEGTLMLQGWKQLEIGQFNASANLQQAAAAMIQARNAAAIGAGQLALLSQEYAFNVKANPLRLQTLNFEKLATQAGWKLKQAQTFEREFKNKMLNKFGAEQLPQTYTGLAGYAEQAKQGLFNILDPRWWLSPLGDYNHKRKNVSH